MTFFVLFAIAFALSFAVEWMTGRGAVATLVPVAGFVALGLWGSSEYRLLILTMLALLGAFAGGWGVFSARALRRRRETRNAL